VRYLLGLLLLASSAAIAADLNVTWKNAAVYTDGSSMPSTDIVSSTVSCGLNQTTLTLTVTAQGAAQSATVPGALSGKVYVCGVVTNSKSNGSSAIAFSNNVTTPAPKPSPPSGVTLTVSATDTTAYKMRQSVDGYSFVAIGTVNAGTACDATHSADGYSPVPRANVKLASKFDTLPLVAFAKCG
jgi:hypothetical protein